MIINSVIAGSRQRVASISTHPEGTSKYLVTNDPTVQLGYLYSSSSGLDAKSIFYYGDEEVSTSYVTPGTSYSWDVSSIIDGPGLYNFRIVTVDRSGNSARIDFKVFYGFNDGDFTFSYSQDLSGYVLVAYSGSSSEVFIPEIFDDGDNGERSVIRISSGVFFDNDSVQTVVIPPTVSSIGATAFFSCSNLSRVEINRDLPPTLEADNVFDPYSPLSQLRIFVPSSSVSAYKLADNWEEYANAIFPIE
jgi:hypothetical protein